MTEDRAQLSVLTIGAIFVVVFAFMYAGVQFSEGELLPEDTTTDAEDDLRAAVWATLDDHRRTAGLEPMPHDRFMRGLAQDTTDTLVAETTAENGTAEPSLSNHRLFCTQVAVNVSASDATAGGDVSRATAEAVADALVEADDTNVIRRPSSAFRAGMGIAVHGDRAYAVYRSCEQVDT